MNAPTFQDCERAAARSRHLDFMRYTWQREAPFLEGFHTKAICAAIDRAFRRFREGLSSFLAIRVPFRHGKSDLVSRYLVPHFLGTFPTEEVLLSTYGASLSYDFSKFSRLLMQSDEYQLLYPSVALARDDRSVSEWSLEGGVGGKVQYSGILGTIVGKGGALVVLDDFLRSRRDAESMIMRDAIWDAFANDLMTRRAPVSIVVVLATPWHVDDLFGRIEDKMAKDDKFPRFETLTFPAMSDEYESGYLFPERFSAEWYESQKATLGLYGTASLLQCSPVVREGGVFRVDKVDVVGHDEPDIWPSDIRWVRGWDLASTKKQRSKDDPDWTVGVKLGVRWTPTAVAGHYLPTVFIDDVIRGRWEALRRNEIILAAALSDGNAVQVGIESVGGYKDAYTELSTILSGVRTVTKSKLPGDKMAKAITMEPAFEAGNVYIREAPWNDLFLMELANFPGDKHDDQVDAMAVAFWMCRRSGSATSAKIRI